VKLNKNDWLLYVSMLMGAIAIYPFVVYLEYKFKEK